MFGSHRQGLVECSQPSGVDNIILPAETGHSSSEKLSVGCGERRAGQVRFGGQAGPM